MIVAAGFTHAREALETLRAMPLGQRVVWFEGRLAIEAHQDRELRCVVEVLNFFAFRGSIECCQQPLAPPDVPMRMWRHYVARIGDIDASDRLLRAITLGAFTGGKRRPKVAQASHTRVQA